MVWVMRTYLAAFFAMTGDLAGMIVVGALLTLMNIIVRPVLNLVTIPLKLFATVLAIIVVNGAFVQMTVLIVEKMDPTVVTLAVQGGLVGWVVVAIVFGVGNWLLKATLK